MRKTGLGKDPLSWIRPTAPKGEKVSRHAEKQDARERPANDRVPKFKTFEVRLTTLLRDDQLEFLDKVTRDIKKNRTAEYRKERITKNTILRALIDGFMLAPLDVKNIADEKALLERLLALIKR